MSETQPLLSPQEVDATPVYPIIHSIRSDIIHFIDTPLSYDALTAPDLTYTLIRPLVEKYGAMQRDGNMSVVFCFLLNRVYFSRDQNMATSPVSRTRAELCEILAIRTLREYGNNLLELAVVLTTSWMVYSGADETVMQMAREEREDLEERVGNAIEMAILGRSKRFIKSSSCQKVIDGIWSLKVPFIRSVLEYTNFLILFVLFILAIEWNTRDELNAPEVIFMVYALGFCLEKVAAMQEHGIQVYFKGTWNGFDLAFVLMVTYAMLSNTLLLTVLVSILSNTFATINEDAAAEAMFRKAVSTIEGVKADSLFSYQPPINLVALCFMLPLSYILTPRWFHKVNVFMIRIMNLPALLVIALYERQAKHNGTTGFYETLIVVTERAYDSLPRQLKRLSIFEGLAGSDSDIDAIFEIEEELDTTQIYQPLVVDDDLPLASDESLDQVPSVPQGGAPLISYGPTTRRRLSSMQGVHRRNTSDVGLLRQSNNNLGTPNRHLQHVQQQQQRSQQNFPSMQEVMSGADGVISESPPGQSPSSHGGLDIPTAGQIQEEEGSAGGASQWSERLAKLEERQERIENLLEGIAKDLRDRGKV
ncbi:hypothetical protein HHX47_DHR6000112 [Lentinula edodes]|nr:hypothetical protein HHX47_DHR6000112 [Lentinula edodes]